MDTILADVEPTRIKVIGVGGGGGNAVEHMISKGVQGVEFICANTDAQALGRSSASTKLQLGTSGLGAGARPDVGRQAAEQAVEHISGAIAGAHMLFITAGMGGGTGTGAAPVIARVAREMGILTVGVVTKPFEFEGRRRWQQAEEGVAELEASVDSLIVVLNEKLLDVLGDDVTQAQAFAHADDVLKDAVAGISDIIHVPGLVNVDFEDVKTVMREPGKARMGTAVGRGPDRATWAAEAAVACPLLDGIDLSGARGVLVLIAASRATFKLRESRSAMNAIRRYAADDANVIYGAAYDDTLGDDLRVTVIATGLGRPNAVPGMPPRPTTVQSSGPRTGTDNLPILTRPEAPRTPAVPSTPDDVGLDTPAVWRRGRSPTQASAQRQPGNQDPALPPRRDPPPGEGREPVHLGVTGPRRCFPGASFNAVLAVYVESLREAVVDQLGRLGGPASEPLMGLAPQRQAGWRVGAPVTVALTATSARVTPAEQAFDWSGRLNLAPFVVSVPPDAKVDRGAVVDLCFSVALAGIPIAFIPLPVELAAQARDDGVQVPRDIPAPVLAFASYASKDAETVGHCLSALSRWSPDFRCIQDCLDLRPGEAFKAGIRSLIETSDRFILFWSRNASASPWVRWEYDTARDTKGLDAVLPMPLEDPSIAPPPREFAEHHMRDRFMMARYALQRVNEVASQRFDIPAFLRKQAD